jgi:M6 family metalloprotease-like protein
MKALSLVMFFMIIGSLLVGAPLRNLATEVTQPDGSKYSCFATGDEYYHRLHDANGFTIVQNPENGWFVYAEKRGSDLLPGSAMPGVDDPAARGLSPNLMPDKAILQRRFENFRGTTRDDYGRAPTIGTVNNLCIFISFSDVTLSGSVPYFNDCYNSTFMASLNGYFMEESASQLNVSTTFYPAQSGPIFITFVDPNPRNFYCPQSMTNPIGYPPGPPTDPEMYGYLRLHIMLTNAVAFISASVPLGLIIDADGDNSVDNISFVCAGNADATGILWPHYWVLDAYGGTPVKYINGKQADDYNFEPQYNDPGIGGGAFDIAVICHEFSHTLGFPDNYHYSFDGLNPCGWWDLMDYAQGTPQHHLAYMKWKYGKWFAQLPLSPPVLPPSGPCSLNAVVYNPFSCYIYQLPTGEQIWIEYRKNNGLYESRLPGSGLIIYRVDQSYYPYGNASGPPDEVYVYRPFVSPGMPDGNINFAQYAWEQTYTAINQFTDPKPFSQSMPGFIASLNIHSIGSNAGPQITFVVGTQIPFIWTGAVDRNWYTPGNWTRGAVPGASDFVIVRQGGLYNCEIPLSPMSGAVCNDLRNEYSLQMWPGASLQVGGNLFSIGRIFMDGNLLQVTGNLTISYWYAGSWLTSTTFPSAQIRVGGNCLFDTGTTISLNVGQLIFYNPAGMGTSTFTMDAFGATFFDIIINNTGGILNYNSNKIFSPPTAINGSLSVMAGGNLLISSPQMINIDGNISIDPAGTLQANLGKIILTGGFGPQSISVPNPMSYVNDLNVNTMTGLTTNLLSNITICGNFVIDAGVFSANGFTMSVFGNWINNVGAGAFIKIASRNTSRVIFCGTANQNITVTSTAGTPVENFYILELAKSSGSLIMNGPGQTVQCDYYDYTSGDLLVLDGVFTALNLSDGCILGGIIQCNAPGQINLTDTMGSADLAANLAINGGTVNISIGAPSPGSVSTWGVNNGSLTMLSGQLNFLNTGINIIPGGGTLSSNITGGTISVAGDFTVFRPEFSPLGGLVVIGGSNPAQIAATSGGTFYDVQASVGTLTTSNAVMINSNLLVDTTCTFSVSSNLTINGALNLDGSMVANSPLTVAIGSAEIDGSLGLSNGAILLTDGVINVNSTGSLSCQGTTTSHVQVTGSTRGYWKMEVNGSIAVDYADFSKLREEGIWVTPSGAIDPAVGFNNCVFSGGQSGSCTFLTLENSQDLIIDNITFTSTGGESYNIAKSVDSGSVLVNSSSGNFAGPLYENDPNNCINWIGYDPNLVIYAFSVSEPPLYIMDQITYSVTILNDSDYPVVNAFRLHLFKNRSTAPGWGDSGDLNLACGLMDPHATAVYTFENIYSATAEEWLSWALLDPEDAVKEANEYDNRASVSLEWLLLPAVEGISITNNGDGSARLAWTFPIWADRFTVYYDSDPYGDFASSLDSTEDLYKDVTLSEGMRFYLVKAVRDVPARH